MKLDETNTYSKLLAKTINDGFFLDFSNCRTRF